MKGEHLCWYMIARKLGKSIGEAQCSITSTEFVDWLVFFRMEQEWERESQKRTPDHFYFASIWMLLEAIYNVICNKKKDLKHSDFLIDFEPENKEVKGVPTKDQEEHIKQQELIKSKHAWASFLTPFMKKKNEPPHP